jgi:sugar lactone lactonase YvrE
MRRILLGLAVLTGGVAYPIFAHADEISIRSVDMILGGPSMTDTFRRPGAMVADTTRGILLIADTGNHRLVAFDRGWRSRGSIVLDERHASEPSALALDAHGRIFVADRGLKQIEVMDPRGTHIKYFMPPLPADATPASPQDIAIGASGRIYLLVSGSHPGLCILDSAGRPLANIGFLPAGQGLWSAPQALAVNADETRIAIVDATASQSVTILDADGREVHGFGQHGEVEAGFSLPNDVTWGVGNTLWITDTLRHSVSVFNERGTLLGRVGGFGREPGQFAYPVGCVFLANDRIAVLERANARCQVFEMEVPASIRQATALDLSRSGLAGTLSRTDREEVR